MRHGIGYHRAPSHGLPPAARNMNAKLDRKSSHQRHPSTVLPGCPRASLEDVNISHKSLPSLPAQRQICTHLDKASTVRLLPAATVYLPASPASGAHLVRPQSECCERPDGERWGQEALDSKLSDAGSAVGLVRRRSERVLLVSPCLVASSDCVVACCVILYCTW